MAEKRNRRGWLFPAVGLLALLLGGSWLARSRLPEALPQGEAPAPKLAADQSSPAPIRPAPRLPDSIADAVAPAAGLTTRADARAVEREPPDAGPKLPAANAAEKMQLDDFLRSVKEREQMVFLRELQRQRGPQLEACVYTPLKHDELLRHATRLSPRSDEEYGHPQGALAQPLLLELTPIADGYEIGAVEPQPATVEFIHSGFHYRAQVDDVDYQRCLVKAYSNLRLKVPGIQEDAMAKVLRTRYFLWKDEEAKAEEPADED